MADDKRTLPGTKIRDLTGETFGRLTVLAYAGPRHVRLCSKKDGHIYYVWRHNWRCHCLCGEQRIVDGSHLLRSNTTSCGCAALDNAKLLNRTHGHSGTALYKRWKKMRARCKNGTCPDYPLYGGRGITVCPEWDTSFLQFKADVGDIPFPGASLERIDNDLGYFPENVRWATNAEQQQNTRRNRFLTFAGETKTLTVWAQTCGLKTQVVWSRLALGWTIEQALTLPLGHRGPR